MKKFIRKVSVLIILCALFSAILAGCISTTPNENIAKSSLDESGSILANEPNDEDATPETPKVTYIRAKIGLLSVRKGPGSQFSSLGTLDKGDMVVYVMEDDGWYSTYYRNQTAFISASSVYTEIVTMEASENANIESVIAIGAKLLGTPYVYGAVRLHSGNGVLYTNFNITKFDCSSLMQYMFYYGANENLLMNTRTQVKQGSYVAKSDLVRGDLMFFTNSSRYYKTGIERVGHVAIYLGDNYILHTASDHAVIEQISATRWSYFIEGRKII
ncbi:MAG TPA: C40 family peptidase [Clostridia bacterium]|nr:C40 family peptidase [Clostridia bacterium]